MENEIIDQSADLAAMRKYCPICGATMHQGVMDDLPAWICDDPECGYFEYIDMAAA